MLEVCLFFFFKQKTAYEIVSRDWSSDVCSSDLTLKYLYVSQYRVQTSSMKNRKIILSAFANAISKKLQCNIEE